MKEIFEIVKKKLIANVVLVLLLAAYLVYSLVTEGVPFTGRVLSFFMLFPLWLGFTLSFLSILFDRALLKPLGKQVLVYFSLGTLVVMALDYYGLGEGLYVYVAGGLAVGLVMFIVMKVFSIGQKN